jgi:5-methylcytosine-specific restriction endonuclease McrA
MRYFKIKKSDRELIYNKCNGHCAYCGKKIDITEMHVDHVKPIRRKHIYDRTSRKWIKTDIVKYPERDTIDNMLPSCAPCNIWKKAKNLETFRKSIKKQINRLENKDAGFRLLERFGLIDINNKSIKFYFEQIQE